MARILIIDDDDAVRNVIARNLTHVGHTIIEAADGRQGIEVFRVTEVDLVLTDLVMPDKEGVETIIELRRESPGLPIIAMSGGMPRAGTYLEIALKLGARRVLEKPFSLETLLAAINESLPDHPPLQPPTSEA